MIRKYQSTDFPWLQQWVTDPKSLFTFAGPSWTFPFTNDQMITHQQKYPGKQLYVGIDENNAPFAIGEIITNEEHAPRLGWLVTRQKEDWDWAKNSSGNYWKPVSGCTNQRTFACLFWKRTRSPSALT